MCVSFVFLALLEYALVNYAARADARYEMPQFKTINQIYTDDETRKKSKYKVVSNIDL